MVNAQEFEREYRRLYMPLGMWALRMTGDVKEAEDLVQSCFESAWRLISGGIVIGALKPYMYRAVRNAFLMSRRGGVETVSIDDCGEVSEEDIDTAERDAALWRAIDSLPSRCREIFLMSKRDGMSNAAIAAELGISVKTVENQMTKAFSTLREALVACGGKVFFLPFL